MRKTENFTHQLRKLIHNYRGYFVIIRRVRTQLLFDELIFDQFFAI